MHIFYAPGVEGVRGFVNRRPWLKKVLLWPLLKCAPLWHPYARAERKVRRLAAKEDWAGAVQFWRVMARRLEDAESHSSSSHEPAHNSHERADNSQDQASERVIIHGNVWLEYGRCCLRLGRLAEAATALKQAQALRPEWLLPRRLLAWVASSQRNWPEAVTQWQGVLAAYDNDERSRHPIPAPNTDADPTASGLADILECLNALADAHISLGQFAEAELLLARLADNGGWRLALERRLKMAKLRYDEKGQEEALARLRHHQQAAGAFLGAAAGAAPAAEDFQQALLQEQNPQQALQTFAALKGLSQTERFDLSRQLADAFPDSAEVQLNHLQQLGECLGCAADWQAMQTRSRAFCARFPEHPRRWWWQAQAAVIADDPAAAAPVVEAARDKLGAHAAVEQIRLWLAAKQGDYTTAYAIAEDLRRRAYVLGEDGRGLDLRPLNILPAEGQWRGRQDRILLFACFRNERDFADWFLDYYRALGVEHFFIVDNLSDDGTAEFLAGQNDVTAFASSDIYAQAHSGIRWINALIRRYGEDNWCIQVDSDEQLLLPDTTAGAAGASATKTSASSPLRRFVDGMATRGEEVLPAYMLDTYPADLAAAKDFAPGDSPLSHSNLIDTDYFFFGGMACPFLRVRGGVRDRLFGCREMIDKAPLLRGGGGRLYRDSHKLSYAKVSSQCGVLLHHKLLREVLDMHKPEAEAARRVADRLGGCRRRHALYREPGSFSGADAIPRGPNTMAYESPAQLQRLGLMGDVRPYGE